MAYAGFWIRFWASVIDTFVMFLLMIPIMMVMYNMSSKSTQISNESMSYSASSYSFEGGENFFASYLIPAILVLAFWLYKSATPGKMLLKLTIVDAKNGEKPTTVQFIIRYLGYFLSSIFLLGFIWVAFDKRKQGWHDKIAGTVVVHNANENRVVFEKVA